MCRVFIFCMWSVNLCIYLSIHKSTINAPCSSSKVKIPDCNKQNYRYRQGQYSKTLRWKCLIPIAQMFRAFSMKARFGVQVPPFHDDFIRWRHFPHYWPFKFPAQRPVTRSFDVFFDLRLNKRLSKQSWGWWFETLSHPLWRHCNVLRLFLQNIRQSHIDVVAYAHLTFEI